MVHTKSEKKIADLNRKEEEKRTNAARAKENAGTSKSRRSVAKPVTRKATRKNNNDILKKIGVAPQTVTFDHQEAVRVTSSPLREDADLVTRGTVATDDMIEPLEALIFGHEEDLRPGDANRAHLDERSYAEVNARNAEINARNAEINARNAEINVRNAEINARNAATNARNAEVNVHNAETNARNVEINGRNADMNARNVEMNARNAEINALAVDLFAPDDVPTHSAEHLEMWAVPEA